MKCMMILSSVTYAMKAIRILDRNNIKAHTVKTPSIQNRGCGYGIEITGSCNDARNILEKNGIKILGSTQIA